MSFSGPHHAVSRLSRCASISVFPEKSWCKSYYTNLKLPYYVQVCNKYDAYKAISRYLLKESSNQELLLNYNMFTSFVFWSDELMIDRQSDLYCNGVFACVILDHNDTPGTTNLDLCRIFRCRKMSVWCLRLQNVACVIIQESCQYKVMLCGLNYLFVRKGCNSNQWKGHRKVR